MEPPMLGLYRAKKEYVIGMSFVRAIFFISLVAKRVNLRSNTV